jgi:predicted HTH domain antitoxin
LWPLSISKILSKKNQKISLNMKKKCVLIALLFLVSISFAQDINGTWYMINRGGLIKMDIDNDSIKSSSFSTDFQNKGKKSQSLKYHKSVNLNDKILFIVNSERDTTKFRAMVFFNLENKKYCQMAWNSVDTSASTIQNAILINQNERKLLFGYTLFSENYIDSLKKMKEIKTMTLSEFKLFLTDFYIKIKHQKIEFDKINIGYVASNYSFQLMMQTLFEMGYNPIQNSRTIDVVFKEFFKDEEVKKIIEGNN